MYLPRLSARTYRATAADRGDDWTPTDDADSVAVKLGKDEPKTDEVLLDEVPKDEKKSALKVDKVDEEAEEETDAKVEDKPKGKESRIPAARHKEILDRERERRTAVENELAKYKQGTQLADVNAEITEAEGKLIALEKSYAKQLTDGEADKAATTMTDIRRLERAINTKTSEMRETAATARAVETVRYDTTVERLEALYPELNVAHDDFDKVKTAEVLELKEAWELKGYTPSAALQKAVKYVMPPETKKQEEALKTDARVDPKKVEAERKAAAVEKTAEAAAKTPPNAAKAGKDHDAAGGGAVTAKDAIKMKHEDFVKLDDDTLARMRGDVL